MRIRELREEKCLSQENLAKLIGTSQRNISRWENLENEPTISFLVKLADLFKVSLDYITEREDDFGNIVVPGQSTDQLPNDEQRLLQAYRKLDKLDKEKLIDDAEYFANRSVQEKLRKGV